MVESVEEARLAVSQRGIEGTRQQDNKALRQTFIIIYHS
jgi:hypothetical protein